MRGQNRAVPFFSNEAEPESSPQVSYETVWPDGQKKRNIRADYGEKKKKTSSQNKTGENVVMRPKRKEKTTQTGMAVARYTDHEQ